LTFPAKAKYKSDLVNYKNYLEPVPLGVAVASRIGMRGWNLRLQQGKPGCADFREDQLQKQLLVYCGYSNGSFGTNRRYDRKGSQRSERDHQ
jgi:hypothetical protein